MTHHSHELSRRSFLRRAALGAAAVAASPVLCRRPAWASGGGTARPGKFLVVINLFGGNDALNTVVPTQLPSYRSRRPNINLLDNLPAGATLHDLDGSHAFHYSMPGLKTLWDEGAVHLVGNVSYPDPNQSHFTSRDIYSHGVRDYVHDGDGRGWLGRFADCYWSSPSDPLGVISVGLEKLADFRSDVTEPLVLFDVPGFSVYPDGRFWEDHQLRESVARDILANDPDPTDEPGRAISQTLKGTRPLVDQVQADTAGWVDPGTYPATHLGWELQTISQLLHAKSTWGTQVYYTGFGGFDTHAGQHDLGLQNQHAGLLGNLDSGITAFADDLKSKGLWNDCCILVISEFGRNTFENGSNGTDHGHGGLSMAIGGAVRGRGVGGSSGYTGAPTEAQLQQDVLPFHHDFRDVYGQVIQSHLGLDPAPLFPDPQYTPNLSAVDLIA